MKGSGRLIILLLLLVLGLHNFISTRILRASLESLAHAQESKIKIVAELIIDDLRKNENTISPRLQSLYQQHHLDLIAVYNEKGILKTCYPTPPPAALIPVLEKPQNFVSNQSTPRVEDYFLHWASYENSGDVFGLLIGDRTERLFQVQRSGNVLSFLNLVILAFAALLGFYLIESTIKPFRVLVQAAKTAQPAVQTEGARNDADFLIATFKGVIAKLKEKEQELGRLHQAEKARADDVHHWNQDILRSIDSGLIVIDPSRNIQIFNQAAQTILQISPVLALKHPYSNVMEALSPDLVADIESCIRDQVSVNRPELEIKLPQGGIRFLDMNIMSLRDRQQAYSGILCIFTDTTENIRLRQHMLQKEKFAGLGEMAAGLAHELRNSLGTITGYAQMLENRIQKEELTYLQPIQKELNLLQKVVNDFLSFAKPFSLILSQVDLEELIKDCVEEAKVSAQNRNVEFEFSGSIHNLEGDESLLRQAFANLIRNAVESIPENRGKGRIQIHGCPTADGESILIEIRDNGSGIAREDITKIFTPFFTKKKGGIGLGLAIVQKVILQHNGTILAESNESGSIFRVQLPLKQNPPVPGS